MLKKKKTTASGKLVLVKSVRRTRSHRMKFCVQRGLGALPSTSKRRGKSRRDFLLCGPVCINTGIACLFSPKMKRTSERIVKFHSLAQFVSNFSDNSVSSLFFRASRIFCPKAVKSSIGIIVHLKYILSCRFAQRNNLIIPVDRYDYTDFVRGNRKSAVVSLMSYVTMLIVRKNKKCFDF